MNEIREELRSVEQQLAQARNQVQNEKRCVKQAKARYKIHQDEACAERVLSTQLAIDLAAEREHSRQLATELVHQADKNQTMVNDIINLEEQLRATLHSIQTSQVQQRALEDELREEQRRSAQLTVRLASQEEETDQLEETNKKLQGETALLVEQLRGSCPPCEGCQECNTHLRTAEAASEHAAQLEARLKSQEDDLQDMDSTNAELEEQLRRSLPACEGCQECKTHQRTAQVANKHAAKLSEELKSQDDALRDMDNRNSELEEQLDAALLKLEWHPDQIIVEMHQDTPPQRPQQDRSEQLSVELALRSEDLREQNHRNEELGEQLRRAVERLGICQGDGGAPRNHSCLRSASGLLTMLI